MKIYTSKIKLIHYDNESKLFVKQTISVLLVSYK